jgi:MFS family permease
VPLAQASLGAALAHVRAHLRVYGFLTAAVCCNVMIAQSQAAWAPLFFVRQFGLAPGASAMLVGTMFLISAPTGQCFGGFLTDRLQARGIPGAQNLVMALFLALALVPGAIFCTTDRLWLAQASYPLFAFLVSAATPTGLAALQLLTPDRYLGTLSALFLSIVTLVGLGLGPALVGLLTDQLFQDERALGRSLLIVILAAGIVGPMLALAGRRPFPRATAAA